jgi:hypothetical protein
MRATDLWRRRLNALVEIVIKIVVKLHRREIS